MSTKVIRGAGGRFERVPDNDIRELPPGPTGPVGPDDSGLVGGAKLALVPTVIQLSESLHNTALELSNALHYTGLIPYNTVYAVLAGDEEQAEVDGEEYGCHHITGLIGDVSRSVAENKLLSTAGNVLGYRVVPALSLALFVLNQFTQHDRSLAFSHLLNINCTDNQQRYENIVELHNAINDNVTAVEAALFGEDDAHNGEYKARLTEKELALIPILHTAEDILQTVVGIFDDLRNRINSQLV